MRAFAVGLLPWIAAAGCLPEAGPGIGDRVVEGRGIAAVGSSRTGGGEGGMLFYTTEAGTASRTLFAVPRAGGEARLLATDVRVSWRQGEGSRDAGGRLLVVHHGQLLSSGPRPSSSYQLSRFDLATGHEESLGRIRFFELSRDGKSLLVQGEDDLVVLRGPDDRVRVLGAGIKEGRFVGGDLYFNDPRGLWQLRPQDEAPRNVASAVTSWRPFPGADGEHASLVAMRGPAGTEVVGLVREMGDGFSWRMIAAGPFLGIPALSPDGQRCAVVELSGAGGTRLRLRVITVATGEEEIAEMDLPKLSPTPEAVPKIPGPNLEIAFRPGSRQVWYFLDAGLIGVQTGAEVRVISKGRWAQARVAGVLASDDRVFFESAGPDFSPGGSLFTASGDRWIYLNGDGHSYLGDANDPEADASGAIELSNFRYVNEDSVREVGQGRWLVVRNTPGVDRWDLKVVDLETLTVRELGRDIGQMVATNQRVLAIVDRFNNRWAPGTLMAYDLATGTQTQLAGNVTEFALEPGCPGCDATASGAGLLYVVQARVPFRYDGLWKAVLP